MKKRHTPTTSFTTQRSGSRLPPFSYVTDFYFYIYRYYRFTMQHHNSLSGGNFAKLLSASLTVQILHICLETIWSGEVSNNKPARSFSATVALKDLVAQKRFNEKLRLSKLTSSVIGVSFLMMMEQKHFLRFVGHVSEQIKISHYTTSHYSMSWRKTRTWSVPSSAFINISHLLGLQCSFTIDSSAR